MKPTQPTNNTCIRLFLTVPISVYAFVALWSVNIPSGKNSALEVFTSSSGANCWPPGAGRCVRLHAVMKKDDALGEKS